MVSLSQEDGMEDKEATSVTQPNHRKSGMRRQKEWGIRGKNNPVYQEQETEMDDSQFTQNQSLQESDGDDTHQNSPRY